MMRTWGAIFAASVVFIGFHLPHPSGGAVLAAILASTVLAWALSRSSASGPELITACAALHFVPSSLINVPEGVLFDVIKPTAAPWIILRALIVSVAAVTVLIAVAGRFTSVQPTVRQESPIRTSSGLLWRLAAFPAVFVFCYFAAGFIIYPFVAPYYHGRAMPDVAAIISMQVLRSLAIVGAAWPLLRSLSSRKDAVLLLSVALPVFGVLDPLLPSNPLMPASVRWVHAMEMVPYYALCGTLIAIWFGPPRRGGLRKVVEQTAVAA